MSAATTPRGPHFRPTGKQPIVLRVQKAGTILYKNCAVGHIAGVAQPMASGVAGLVFAGFAEDTYDCSMEGSNYTWPTGQRIVCNRYAMALDGLAGDLPTDAELGKKLTYFADDQTVKKTGVTDDVAVNLIEIEPGRYWVEA